MSDDRTVITVSSQKIQHKYGCGFTAQLQVRVTPESLRKYHVLAQERGMALSNLVREMLDTQVKELGIT